MAVTIDDKIKVIMKDPKAVELIEKYLPGFGTNPQMKMVQGMTLRALAKFPQANVSEETLAQIIKELAELD